MKRGTSNKEREIISHGGDSSKIVWDLEVNARILNRKQSAFSYC